MRRGENSRGEGNGCTYRLQIRTLYIKRDESNHTRKSLFFSCQRTEQFCWMLPFCLLLAMCLQPEVAGKVGETPMKVAKHQSLMAFTFIH